MTPDPLLTVAVPSTTAVNVALVIWMAWMTMMVGRLMVAVVWLRRAKRACRTFPAAREARLRSWMALRGSGRRATLACSDDVHAAALLGLGAPVIAVSPGVADRLSDEELDLVVLHERAHLQRRDDQSGLALLVLRVFAGLHPAVWWIDRQLRFEREMACDDLVVRTTGSARAYAACLTKLASLPRHSHALAMAPGLGARQQLTTRVMRLLSGAYDRRRAHGSRGAMLMCAIVIVALTLSALDAIGIAAPRIDVTRAIEMLAPARTAQAGERTAGNGLPLMLKTASKAASKSAIAPAARVRVTPQAVPVSWPSMHPAQANGHAPAAAAPAPEPMAVGVSATSTLDAKTMTMPMPVLAAAEAVRPARAESAVSDAELSGAVPPPGAAGPMLTTTPWKTMADAGVAVGDGSRKAAVVTAGFFMRVSKSIAKSF